MYTPPGANPNELGDITVITHAGQIHLFHLTLLQSLPARLRLGIPVRVRVLASGECIEVCLDDVVYLRAGTYRAQRGRFAFFAENARARFSPLRVQPLRMPRQAD
jgi:hypothetical protein